MASASGLLSSGAGAALRCSCFGASRLSGLSPREARSLCEQSGGFVSHGVSRELAQNEDEKGQEKAPAGVHSPVCLFYAQHNVLSRTRHGNYN